MNVILNAPTLNGKPFKLARTVADVAQELIDARTIEDRAVLKRRNLEAELAELVGVPTEGTETKKLDGFKITVSQPITRKIDFLALDKISEEAFPDAMRPVKWSRDVDKKQLDYLKNYEPDLYMLVAKVMTTTPNKVAVKAEPIE